MIYAHDPDGQVTAVFNGSTGAGRQIAYDADGNIKSVTAMPAGTLAIAQADPPSGAPGTSVTIYGTGFGSDASAATITIGGAAAAISSITQNEISTAVPSGASGSGVSVTVAGVTASGSFAVPATPPGPSISGLSEQVADPGSTLTVSGTGFDTDAAKDIASINGTKVAVTSATATALQVTLPPLAVAGQVTVTTPGGTTTSSAQVITTPPPYLAANVGFGGELANGTTTTVTLPSANQIALALFSVQPGQRASVKVKADIPDPGGETNQYSIDVYGPDGQQVDEAQAGDVFSNPDTWYLPDDSPPGTYEIELVPVNGDTGSFQVTATTITDPTASMTIGGPAVPVKVTTAGQRPVWTFSGGAGQSVYVKWSPVSVGRVQLLSPDGSAVAFDTTGDEFLTARLPSAGVYEFVIDDEPVTGTFTAQVSAVPADATGSTTVGGTPAPLTISAPGQDGSVTFSGTAGQQAFTKATFGTTPLTAGMTVFAPDGSMVGQASYDSGPDLAVDTITLPASGTYRVQLSNLSMFDSSFDEVGYTGTITVAVTSAPDVTATTTVDGTPASLSIATPGQHGVASFSGTAGQKVFTSLTMSPAESTTGRAQLIEEPSGTVLGSNPVTGSSGSIDTVTLPATGSYEVLADPVDATGGYTGTISVAVTSAPDQTASTTVDGTPATVTLANPGEQAVVSFPATSGQEIFTQIGFSVKPTQCGNADLVDTTSGEPVSSAGCLNSAPVYMDSTTLNDTGTYQVVVTPAGGYTGKVTVTITSVPAPATASASYGGAAAMVTTAKPGQDASISFTGVPASTKDQLTITASTFPGGGVPYGILYNPKGNIVTACLNPVTVGVFCTATLSAAGTYTLDITHSGPYTGSVSAQLAAAPAGGPRQPGKGQAPQREKSPRPRQSTGIPRTAGPTHSAGARPAAAAPRTRQRYGPPVWAYTGPVHRLRPASLTGTIRTTSGAPLAGVTVRVRGRSARTSSAGRFRLTGLPQGMQILEMDGRTASTSRRSFGVFDVQVRLRAGANRLPFTSYFPVLDTRDEVRITEPLDRNVTLTTPAIPGLRVNLPKGIRITDADGKPVYKIGITAIPVKRTPIPMPKGEQVPVYFTVQPAGGHITHGWATIDYPNYRHAKPGTTVNFWHYDLHGAGWGIYGTGTVSKSGTQVLPGKDTWVTDFNGAMISVPGYPDPLASWLAKFLNSAGDPVDPSSGLYQMTQTDLSVNDVLPLTLTRGYNSGDGNPRQFGNNSSDIYDTFLTHDQPEPAEYTEADLNLIDGARIHFTRITPGTDFEHAVLEAQSTSPAFYHALLTWNGLGWNLTLRDGLTLIYGENEPLQAIRDANGNTLRIYRMYQGDLGQYDGPITNVVSPNGYWLAYSWNNANTPQITQVTDNAGQSVSYTYSAAGNLKTVTDPGQQVTTYGYNASNELNSITDAKQIPYLTNKYTNGQVTTQTIAGQGSYQLAYTPGAGTQVTEPDGTVRNLAYDSSGYLASDQRAAGTSAAHTITVNRDSSPATQDLPGSVSDGMGRTITTQYDGSGDELTNTYSSGGSSVSSSASYAGAPFGLPASVTPPDGNTEQFGYNAGGDLNLVTDAAGNTGKATYNAQGEQKTVTTPLGNKTTSTYTGGLLTSTTDPLGQTTRYAYDQAGRLIQTISPDGATTATTYNADNQVTSTTDADGNTTRYGYDANGNLHTVTDPDNNPTTYGYNNADQLTTVTDAMNNTTIYHYNPAGQIDTVTDPKNQKTIYQYDSLGRLTFAGYDADGSGGYQSTLTYNYDPATGNLDSVADSTSGAGTITYKYDALDHVKTETGPGGTITYNYNAAGQLDSMTPPGQSAVSYTYNADGQLKTESQGAKSASFAYDDDGRLQTETMPDGITASYSYDADGEITEIDYAEGSTAIGNVTYTYNPDGQRTSEGGSLVNPVLPAVQSGNTYNADNQLTNFGGTAYSYDADGNLTSDGTNTYGWNARGQLTSVTGPAGTSTLGYDPLGRLVSTTVGGVTTTFAYQGSQLVSQSGGGVNASYLNGPSGVLASTDHATGAIAAYLPDALGSTMALTNSTGQVATSYSYDLFGNATSSAGTSDPNPVRYTGLISGPVMPAGLQDNNARDYSPATSRFISADPTGMTGSGDNLYGYANEDPADNSDPSGLQPQGLLLVAACVAGGLANDLGGALDGRKHSLGDFFTGGAAGCLNGALLSLDGAGEALDALEGADTLGDGAASVGTDGAEDYTGLGDDLSGDGTGEDGQGEDSCTTQPNSFPGHTKVKMADGTTRLISEVKPGDKVLATNPKTGKTQAEPVLAVIRGHKTEHYAALTITTGRGRDKKTGVIVATTGHRFYDTTRHAWVTAGSLRRGDRIATLHSAPAVVTASRKYNERLATAFNLTIATDHDYYIQAGADTSILAHNCPAETPDLRRLARQLRVPVNSRIFQYRNLTVAEYASRFLKGSIWQVLGREYADMTVEEALQAGGTTIRKLLTDSRFWK